MRAFLALGPGNVVAGKTGLAYHPMIWAYARTLVAEVSNALDVVGDALSHARTDDALSYADASVPMPTKPGLLERLRTAHEPVSRQVVDRKEGYDVVFGRLLDHVRRMSSWGA